MTEPKTSKLSTYRFIKNLIPSLNTEIIDFLYSRGQLLSKFPYLFISAEAMFNCQLSRVRLDVFDKNLITLDKMLD